MITHASWKHAGKREYDDYSNALQVKEDVLPFASSWEEFSHGVTTSAQTETVALEFSLPFTSAAAAWIRDIEFVPLDAPPQRP